MWQQFIKNFPPFCSCYFYQRVCSLTIRIAQRKTVASKSDQYACSVCKWGNVWMFGMDTCTLQMIEMLQYEWLKEVWTASNDMFFWEMLSAFESLKIWMQRSKGPLKPKKSSKLKYQKDYDHFFTNRLPFDIYEMLISYNFDGIWKMSIIRVFFRMQRFHEKYNNIKINTRLGNLSSISDMISCVFVFTSAKEF